MIARALFVAGAHTDVGKTHVACALIRTLRARGITVEALKPVVSGFDPDDWADSDPGRLLQALGRPLSAPQFEAMSPWRFHAPLAPPMAAKREGKRLELAPIVDFCRRRIAQAQGQVCLVEGLGGVMSPLAEGATILDLMAALAAPSILVGGAYLGAISHILTAAETLKARGLPLAAVVVSESAEPAAPDFEETVASITEHLAGRPVFAAPRVPDDGWAQGLADLVAGA